MLGELAWKVIPSAASAVAGAAGALWRLTKSLEDRIKHLEDIRVRDLENKNSTFDESYKKDIGGLKTLLDTLRKDLEKEVEELYSELRGRSKERLDARRLQSKLSERYLALESRVEVAEKAITSLHNQFVEHAKGQNEQWQEIARALGHIEGWLRAMSSRRNSSEFQAPQIPPRK